MWRRDEPEAPPRRMVTPARRSCWLTVVAVNAQLGTDLAQGPALGVQVGCTLNVHGATVTTAPCIFRRG